MVTQALIFLMFGLGTDLFGWLGSHLPNPPVVWSNVTSAIDSVTGATSTTVLYFLPVGPAIAIGIVATQMMVALGVLKLVRVFISLFTGGGGAAP